MSKFEELSINRIEIIKREEAEDAERKREHEKEALAHPPDLSPSLRNATTVEYREWLEGYINRGGSVTQHYNGRMNDDRYYVAIEDFELHDNCGAFAYDIIVPIGVSFLGGELGHCNLYFMDGFATLGWHVPMWNDTCAK